VFKGDSAEDVILSNGYPCTLPREGLLVSCSETLYFVSGNEANAIGVPALVAKPWGENFEGRTRALIVDLVRELDEIAEEVHRFMERAPSEPPSDVSTWSEVAREYINRLYTG